MSELLPCPFCGGIASIDEYPSLVFPYFVFCRGCGAETDRYKTKQEVIKSWNTRAERTCHIDGGYYDELLEFQCTRLSCGHDIPWDTSVAVGLYCAYCGAKVVTE